MGINYDRESDVLYISFVEPPVPAICDEVEEGILVRHDMNTDAIVGVTIIDFQKMVEEFEERLDFIRAADKCFKKAEDDG
ncbi:DUF2283 domain-containing protein [Candidatus Pacearchaeota archaeon]|jgi:uncharacterized protein YuzE|nr:DUF2283 domain-containing protein [Candidatus Pacearchaeota archaeon]